jgi:hypothetical protein
VRHAPAIAFDDDTLAGTLHARGLAVHAERRVLEAAAKILGLHAIEERRQALVQLRLVVRVPVEDEAAVLPGRQDVERHRRVVLATRLGRGGRQPHHPEDDHRDGSDPQHVYPSPGSTMPDS